MEPQDAAFSSKEYFEDGMRKRYRLCCCHVRLWAVAIGALELVLLLIHVIAVLPGYVHGTISGGVLVGAIVGLLLGVTVVALLIFGIKNENPSMLIPHIIALVLSVLSCLIGGIITLVVPSTSRPKEATTLSPGGEAAIMFVAGLVQAFFLFIVIRTYHFLRERRFLA